MGVGGSRSKDPLLIGITHHFQKSRIEKRLTLKIEVKPSQMTSYLIYDFFKKLVLEHSSWSGK
jgi:hypothetical protein